VRVVQPGGMLLRAEENALRSAVHLNDA
jgi:hypothetical protein